MEIYSENLLESFDIDTKAFARIAGEILSDLLGADGEASVIFVSDKKIHELNRTYRHVDRPTDVLSFGFLDDEMSHGMIGDVYISLDTAKRQAEERGAPLNDELLRLMVHGLLHLAGHTHDGEEDTSKMKTIEDRLFLTHYPISGGTNSE